MKLDGKRVLYIAPDFFGLDAEIENELAERGAVVDRILDRPFSTPLMAALTKYARPLIIPWVDRHYDRRLIHLNASHYDIIFVVTGQTLSPIFLRNLRTEFPRATFLLYMWDSVANRRSSLENFEHFDEVYTFDLNDSERYGAKFRPTFFPKAFEITSKPDIKFDISFVGTAHTDRAPIVWAIEQSLPTYFSRYWHLYLQAPWVLQAYRAKSARMRQVPQTIFNFNALTRTELHTVTLSSRAILEIEHPNQSGLTTRSFESIGASKKLITTNTSIRKYDFFDETNVLVIDRKNPKIDAQFLSSEYRPLSQKMYEKYSISGWMSEILSNVA